MESDPLTMYRYTDFDRRFVHARAAQYRDQLERHLSGQLSTDDFRALRLQNGWYIQRYAPMLRVAVPYGELSSAQLRVLARIAREYDHPSKEVFDKAIGTQATWGTTHLPVGYGHFTTRQNVQFNWIPLTKSADVMDLLATVNMHGIQTSGNCIRNITSDERAGVAPDEIADPRPFAEIMRQWSTLHPEFAFLPRKFKIAITGATEDRAAVRWHDVGLHLIKNEAGELGFRVFVGGGMGRTPVISTEIRAFLPWNQIMNYLEAVVRVYNCWGRRDNLYKARIKILVKAEGQRYIDEVEAEYEQILTRDGAPHTEHPGTKVVGQMLAAGRPGRLRGAGFYDYDESGSRQSLWAGLAELFPVAEEQPSIEDVKDRMLFAEALETAKCFEEDVITSAAAANIGSIMGIGFPPMTGGAAQFMTGYVGKDGTIGLQAFCARADELAASYGERFAPTPWLRDLAASGGSFPA
eukprot:gene42079-51372_t